MKTMVVVVLLLLSAVSHAQQPSDPSDKHMEVCRLEPVQPCAQHGRAIKAPQPEYSKEARAAKIEGNVLLKVLVGLNGRAEDIIVLRGPGYGLEAQAVKIIKKKWVFQPATYNGSPVAAWQQVDVSFRLY